MPKSLKDFVAEAKRSIREVSVEQAADQRTSVMMLDVREPGEVANGRVPGSLNVPRGMLEAKADLEYPNREARLADRAQPIIIYCATGGRSALAADALQQMGFTNVTSMAGGFNAWLEKGLPTEKS